MSCQRVSVMSLGASQVSMHLVCDGTPRTYLLQGLIVDEASSILRDLELAFLDLLAKLPGAAVSSAFHFWVGRERYAAFREGHSTEARSRDVHSAVLAPAEP